MIDITPGDTLWYLPQERGMGPRLVMVLRPAGQTKSGQPAWWVAPFKGDRFQGSEMRVSVRQLRRVYEHA